MSFLAFEIIFILFLIIANAVFSMSEIAVISARKIRLQQLAEGGDTRAGTALELANSPNLFLGTIQIGITLIDVLTGAYGAVTISTRLAQELERIPTLAPYGHGIAVGVVVLVITFLSLVLGELVPKRLALNNPEGIASFMAHPMRLMSRVASPVVRLLSLATEVTLRFIGFRPSEGPPVTEEEIKQLIDQGTVAGVFEEEEKEMLARVFRLGDRRVGAIMTHRKKILWLDVNDPIEKTMRRIARSVYSRLPVCRERLGNVLGVVHVKELLTCCLQGQALDLERACQPPLYVHENMHVLKVMELFRESGVQFALVIDEYGTIEGVVTVNDILESIVGDIPSFDELEEPKLIQREDGSFLVDGTLPIDEVKEVLEIKKLPGEKTGHYHTLGGFVMTYLKRIPAEGDRFHCCGLRFEVVDMDGHRVDKVLISAAEQTP